MKARLLKITYICKNNIGDIVDCRLTNGVCELYLQSTETMSQWLYHLHDEYELIERIGCKPLKEIIKKDPVVKSVLKKYKQRSKLGIEKYGCTLERTDLSESEWFEHLQSELMDATLYIERILKALQERK